MRAKGLILLVMAVLAALLTNPGAAGAAAAVEVSTFTLVGPGGAREWSHPDYSVETSRQSSRSLIVRVMDGYEELVSLHVEAPWEEPLTVGTYDGATSRLWPPRRREDPSIRMSFRSSSLEGSGRFTIYEVPESGNGDVWLTFEFHSRLGESWFGEARSGIRVPETGLGVTPARVAWPDEYPGRTGDVAPVTLTARGDAPVEIHDVAVTAGASEFAVKSHDCTVLAPGESCRVELAFTPTSPGLRTGTVTIRDSTAAGVHSVTVSGQGIPGVSSWTLDSPPSAGMGGVGRGAVVDPASYHLSGMGTPTRFDFAFDVRDGVEPPTDFRDGSAIFATDAEHPLVAGQTFTGATRYGFSTAMPQMEVSLNHIGCNSSTGQFTVREATYDGDRMRSAEIDFEQRCSDRNGTLKGTIKWRADQGPTAPPPPGDVTAPAPVTGLRAVATQFDPFVLVWDDSVSSDWADVVVRGAPGGVPPQSPQDGYAVYRGRLTSTVVNELALVGEHSFSVFTRDMVGNVSAPATITVQDMVPPQPATNVKVDTHDDVVDLSWDDPVAPDWDHAFVTVADWPGGGNQRTIDVGRATSATVAGVDGSSHVTFTVSVADTAGNVNKGTRVFADRTDSTFVSSASRVTCGQQIMLEGKLSDQLETYAKFFGPIVLQSRNSADQPWVDQQEYRGLYGYSTFYVTPCANTEYRTRYDGELHHLRNTSAPVTVLAAPSMHLAAVRDSGPLGTRFPLVTRVTPKQQGLPMVLQRRTGTGWRTIRTKPLDERGVARFVVTPGWRGTFSFRVVSPANPSLLRAVTAVVRVRVF